jgi:hypothetical protein
MNKKIIIIAGIALVVIGIISYIVISKNRKAITESKSTANARMVKSNKNLAANQSGVQYNVEYPQYFWTGNPEKFYRQDCGDCALVLDTQ